MKAYAWTWKIKNDFLEKYKEMHLNPWPDVLKEHTKAGIHNYSIFQNGNQFFYYFECDNVEEAFKYLATSNICKKWNSITSKMVEGSFNFNEEKPIKFLERVFYLK